MVQIPRNKVVARGKDTGSETATYLQNMANQFARGGWEFYRIDTVGVVNPGFLGAADLGEDKFTAYQIITFRRPVSPAAT
jgi:hypothetical protein